MIPRAIEDSLRRMASSMPVVSVTGPRQSGKSTLVRAALPEYHYVNLEEPDERAFALEDPRGFLDQHEAPVIIDEAQHAPELFSYIQVRCDERDEPGLYVLTGSQNFLLSQKISQSLAGRVAIARLLPFSLAELRGTKHERDSWEEYVYTGLYPRVHDKRLRPQRWYADYIETYVERDVRSLLNVGDLRTFRTFLGLAAGRIGQLVDLTSLGNDTGVSYQTVKRWLSVLEASYIVTVVQPYHRNFSKRLIKSPKVYFNDTGLACSLLGIRSASDVSTHWARGVLFENLMVSECLKHGYNAGDSSPLYFWRDSRGREIDCVLDRGSRITALEIKSGKTISTEFVKNLEFFAGIAGDVEVDPAVVYGGEQRTKRSGVDVVGWRDVGSVLRR